MGKINGGCYANRHFYHRSNHKSDILCIVEMGEALKQGLKGNHLYYGMALIVINPYL
jgi:hypothetical protein